MLESVEEGIKFKFFAKRKEVLSIRERDYDS